MPKNWKYIKKLLEKEFLCESLRGHITYHLTEYSPAPWYQQHFVIKYDDKIIFEAQMSEYLFSYKYKQPFDAYTEGRALSDELHRSLNIAKVNGLMDSIDSAAYSAMRKIQEHIAHANGTYGVREIIDSIGIYLHSDIKESLAADEPFIRILAIFDRRCGKRTLKDIACSSRPDIPDWVKPFYRIRLEVEGIRCNNCCR